MLDGLVRDLRYTLRLIRRAPLFALTIVLTLMLGIGATTTIFSVVHALILTPLPFGAPDRLMWIFEKNDRLNLHQFSASTANYLSWQPQMHAFDDSGVIGFGSYNLGGDGADAEQLSGGPITAGLLSVLGLRPVAGRDFRPGEEVQGAPPVALISERLWRRRFGGQPSAIGRHVTINAADVEIVGVAPAALALVATGDVWVPLDLRAEPRHLNHLVLVVGRRRAGVTVTQAQADMDAVATNVGRTVPEVKDWGIELVSLSDQIVGPQLATSLWILFGAVGCVLLIACANVANLLLSRALVRERELALRTAIGATRSQLIRQLLLESVVLSVVGGLAGLAVASTGLRVLSATLPPTVLPPLAIRIDGAVLVFTALVAVGTGVLFGLAPAWTMTRTDLHAVLKQVSRAATSGRSWLRASLAAGELALATMLLVGAGLLGQTLLAFERQPIGFAPDHLLTFQVSPPVAQYPLDSKAPVFYASLLDTLRAIPGVDSAALSSGVPLGNGNYTTTPMIGLGGLTDVPAPIDWRIVSPDFFGALRIPLLRGRTFTNADRAEAGNVAIVSEATAKRFWGSVDVVGRTIQTVAGSRASTIVGVVGDVRNLALDKESPALYYPSPARVWPTMDLIVRTAQDPVAVVPAVRQAVRHLDPGVPIFDVKTETEWVSGSAAAPRMNATLLGLFAVVALLIAAVGVYGILAYSVTQRTREIGLRMALGASRGGVLRLVVTEGMVVGLSGIGVGLVGALALGRLMASIVFGVPVHDPATFVGVATILAVVALLACAVPAARASRVDPQVALRGD